MRRRDREVKDRSEIMEIVKRCDVMRIGMIDKERSYVVPMSFGYLQDGEDITFYFHCAIEGRKLEILKKNPNVCFECDRMEQILTSEMACGFSIDHYESVIGEGIASFVEGEEKIAALDTMITRYMDGKKLPYDEKALARICAFKIQVTDICGKRK